jgi:hypothetical protein
MRNGARCLFLVVGLLLISMTFATAAPPLSCAGKFVGTWTVHVLATGQTYPAVILPGGTTHVTCPMCTPTATWTCTGDTITLFVNGITVSHTLAPDGRSMSGGGHTLTRVGAAPAVTTLAPQQQGSIGEKSLASPDSKKPVAEKKTAAPQKRALASNSMPKSANCSDITGTGGGPGPSNCAPASGVPANIQAQIAQAQSYMQAAQTVKQSDPSYTGWSAAAAQYRKAEAAFRLAGDLAHANAAAEQAQTLETALKISNAQSGAAATPKGGTAASSPSIESNSCPPVAPAKYWQGTPNADYCAHANCVDRGSAYYGVMCFGPTGRANRGDAASARTGSANRGDAAPARFKGIAPDVRAEIFALGDSIIDRPDDDPDRDNLVRALERRLADHRVRMKPQDLACLQPIRGTDRRLDIPLRWRPDSIKKEAIDQSHLCDDVPEGDAKDACREDKFGQAVMWAEPELAGQCRTAEMPNNRDIEAIAECAKRKFLNAWDKRKGIASAPTPANWILPATCNATASPAVRKQAVRALLAAAFAAADNDLGNGNDGGTVERPVIADNPSPPPPPEIDENEAYCNYMARAIVRGELTPGPATAIPSECKAEIAAALALKAKQQAEGHTPFTMDPDETATEIRRLTGGQ